MRRLFVPLSHHPFGPASRAIRKTELQRPEIHGHAARSHPKASVTGIFKEVKLNRGRAAAFASQEG